MGRTAVDPLQLNTPTQVAARGEWRLLNLFP